MLDRAAERESFHLGPPGRDDSPVPRAQAASPLVQASQVRGLAPHTSSVRTAAIPPGPGVQGWSFLGLPFYVRLTVRWGPAVKL